MINVNFDMGVKECSLTRTKIANLKAYLSILLAFSFIASSSQNLHKADNIDLSNKAVLCMYQDENGFLWVGTYDGLNLFNSKNAFVYRFDLQTEKSLSSNIIHK